MYTSVNSYLKGFTVEGILTNTYTLPAVEIQEEIHQFNVAFFILFPGHPFRYEMIAINLELTRALFALLSLYQHLSI